MLICLAALPPTLVGEVAVDTHSRRGPRYCIRCYEVMRLQGLRLFVFFLLGGTAYVTLEILWRGFSHYSMFLAGGLCFLLLGKLQMLRPQLYLPLRLLLGAVVITSVELLMGLLFNRGYQIWDYRRQLLNFHGQICLKFFCLWIPISGFAMWIYEKIDMMFAFGK